MAGRKTYLFCFLDDHSRAVMGARWGLFEDVVRLTAALRNGLAAHGIVKSRSMWITGRRSSTMR